MLKALVADQRNVVYIISGRGRSELGDWFESVVRPGPAELCACGLPMPSACIRWLRCIGVVAQPHVSTGLRRRAWASPRSTATSSARRARVGGSRCTTARTAPCTPGARWSCPSCRCKPCEVTSVVLPILQVQILWGY